MSNSKPEVVGFFDEKTFSVQYVCIDNEAARCAIIDPVLVFDEASATTSTESADEIVAFIRSRELTVDWILDTHPHADHLSAAVYLQEILTAPEVSVSTSSMFRDSGS